MILFLYLLSMLCSKLLGSCFLITWYVLVCLLIILHYYHTPLQVKYFKMHWIDFLHNYLLVCCCLKTVYSFNKKYLKFLYYCDIRTYEQFFIWRIKHVWIRLCLSKAVKINLKFQGVIPHVLMFAFGTGIGNLELGHICFF